jgi:hypothetical protein
MTKYVNVYDVTRCFGGPEEGGWWYDAGDCILSLECASTEEARFVARRLAAEYPTTGNRYSVLGGDDYDVLVESHKGESFPAEVPRYE